MQNMTRCAASFAQVGVFGQPKKYKIHCRYLLASSPKTMYVSFIGTKLAKDMLVDANMFHRPLWKSQDAKQACPAGVFIAHI